MVPIHANMKNVTDDQPTTQVVIVSPDKLHAGLLISCLDASLSIAVRRHPDLPLQNLIDVPSDQRIIYLLDCLKADVVAIETILNLGLARVPDHVMIALYNILDEGMLAPLVKRYKIRGIFFRDDSQAVFTKGMHTVLSGRLWLSRKMLSECVRLTNDTLCEPSAHTLVLLSRREKEILKHVVFGESNQEIADAMQISLHTVKTHLYNTYKKIKVPNRLQAALWGAIYLRNHTDG